MHESAKPQLSQSVSSQFHGILLQEETRAHFYFARAINNGVLPPLFQTKRNIYNNNLNMIMHTMMSYLQVLTIHVSSTVYLLLVFDLNFLVGSVLSPLKTLMHLRGAQVTLALMLRYRILGISGFGDVRFVFLGTEQAVYRLQKPAQNCSCCVSSLRSNKCAIPYKVCHSYFWYRIYLLNILCISGLGSK